MKGYTRTFLGLFWIGCGVYAIPNVNPKFSTGAVVLSGFAIALMIIIGVVIACRGVEQLQRGE
jgi:tellurite resistance protein TehA-like permease